MAALGKIRLSPWLIALLAAGWLLEEGFPTQLVVSLLCVVLHEGGHVLCARLCGCEVERMELTPFGGVARIAGMEQLSATGRMGIALAGPAVNLMLALFCGSGAYLLPEGTQLFAEGLQSNTALMLFNLLPAYPMDGGRVLCALLEGKSGPVRAQRVTAGLGAVLGLVLAGMGAASWNMVGKVNLTLLLCGGYLCTAAVRAWRETPYACASALAGRENALKKRKMLPVRTIAVREGMTGAQVAARLRPGALYRVVYLDDGLKVTKEAWETEILRE